MKRTAFLVITSFVLMMSGCDSSSSSSTCGEGYIDCDGKCVEMGTDARCSSCNDECGNGTKCQKCENVFACLDLSSDNNNCGSCGNKCSGDEVCENGQCADIVKYGGENCSSNTQCKSDSCTSGVCLCLENEHCPDESVCENYSCKPKNVLNAGETCKYNLECQSGVCENKVCTCSEKALCSGTNICVQGKCVRNEGVAGSSCQKDEECKSNRCLDQICACNDSSPCKGNEQCVSGRCEVPGRYAGDYCDQNDDCKSNLCHNHKCLCTDSAQCKGDTVCDGTSCIETLYEDEKCTKNIECKSGVCDKDEDDEYGYCLCVKDEDCEGDGICVKNAANGTKCLMKDDSNYVCSQRFGKILNEDWRCVNDYDFFHQTCSNSSACPSELPECDPVAKICTGPNVNACYLATSTVDDPYRFIIPSAAEVSTIFGCEFDAIQNANSMYGSEDFCNELYNVLENFDANKFGFASYSDPLIKQKSIILDYAQNACNGILDRIDECQEPEGLDIKGFYRDLENIIMNYYKVEHDTYVCSDFVALMPEFIKAHYAEIIYLKSVFDNGYRNSELSCLKQWHDANVTDDIREKLFEYEKQLENSCGISLTDDIGFLFATGCYSNEIAWWGNCYDLCADNKCGNGEICWWGECLDLCANINCSNDSICEKGFCVPSCKSNPSICKSNEKCGDDGKCVMDKCYYIDEYGYAKSYCNHNTEFCGEDGKKCLTCDEIPEIKAAYLNLYSTTTSNMNIDDCEDFLERYDAYLEKTYSVVGYGNQSYCVDRWNREWVQNNIISSQKIEILHYILYKCKNNYWIKSYE